MSHLVLSFGCINSFWFVLLARSLDSFIRVLWVGVLPSSGIG